MSYLPTDFRIMNDMVNVILDFAQRFDDCEARKHYIQLAEKCSQLAWEFFDLEFDFID